MSIEKRLIGVNPSGGDKPNVEDVFSTNVYTGNASAQKITTNVDINEYGGMIWSKNRSSSSYDEHLIMDNVQSPASGSLATLVPSNTFGASYQDGSIGTYVASGWGLNDDGFTLGQTSYMNLNNVDYVAWTFRKAPRFFDVVTYTGNGVAGREIAHDLGCDVGMVIIKCTDTNTNGNNSWLCLARKSDGSFVGGDGTNSQSAYGFGLNLSNQAYGTISTTDAATHITDSSIKLRAVTGDVSSGNANLVNASNKEFVAYIFAHDPDGEDDDGMIACGSYTGNGSSDGPEINLGWEPQYVMVKSVDDNGHWLVMDSMRGMIVGDESTVLAPNLSSAESGLANLWGVNPTPTGFKVNVSQSQMNSNGDDYIYMAIRAPMMKEPEDATDVFDVTTGTLSNGSTQTTGFPIDMQISRAISNDAAVVIDRLRGTNIRSSASQARGLYTSSTSAENTNNNNSSNWDNTGFDVTGTFGNVNAVWWNFKRAKGFFDAVAYKGTGSARDLSHNLQAVPEMYWIKGRDESRNWIVYADINGTYKEGQLHSNTAFGTASSIGGDPTDSVLKLGTTWNENRSGYNYIAYLFASLDGISKVGSYTGNGSSQTIDCGFSNGARFILIKGATNTENWYVFDSVRGIVAGNDARIQLDNTSAEFSNVDLVDPHNSGFIINSGNEVNASGIDYIFYAIA
jgi:hypothetical protein